MSALQPMKSSSHRAETERDGELRWLGDFATHFDVTLTQETMGY